jgi:DNA invertase Pin-like site-specific DNA recombinase
LTRTPPTITTHPDTRRPAVYLRVSTDRQELDRQERQLDLARRDFPRVEPITFEDEGVSAFKIPLRERPEGRKLVEAIERGEVAAVYADAQDRLSRSEAVEWLTFQALCYAQETRILLDGRELSYDDAGQLMGVFAALQARRESSDKQHRSKSAALSRAERGYHVAGMAPTGYRLVKAGDGSGHKTYEPTEDADRIRQGFERVAEGASIHGTARALGFHPTTFSGRILRRVEYTGVIELHGQEYPGKHPAIISRALFDRVQTIQEQNGHTGFRDTGKRQPFGTLARCAACGKLLVTHLGGSANYRYACKTGSPKEGHASAPAESVEAIVLAAIFSAQCWLIEALSGDGWRVLQGNQEDADNLAAELELVREQIDTNVRLATKGGDVAAAAEAQLDGLNSHAAELRRGLEAATADADTLWDELKRLAQALSFDAPKDALYGAHLLVWWQDKTAEEKRAAMDSVFERIELGPNFLRLTFKYGIPRPVTFALPRTISRNELRGVGLGPRKAGDSAEGLHGPKEGSG